jgi:ketosteroid isomerase-like protein
MPPDAVARLAIADLVARYCDAVARADATQFGACWAPDARWTGPGLDRTGADEITRTWARMRARFTLALQAIQSGTVHVDGTGRRATGTWWIRELLEQSDGVVRETVGRYDDEYVAGVDGWQFASRRFTPPGG